MRVIIIEGASEDTIRALLLNTGMQAMIMTATPIATAAAIAAVTPHPAEVIHELNQAEVEQLEQHACQAVESRVTPIYDEAKGYVGKRQSMQDMILGWFMSNPNNTAAACIDALIAAHPFLVARYGHIDLVRKGLRNIFYNLRMFSKIVPSEGTKPMRGSGGVYRVA